MIAGHVPAVCLSPDHAGGLLVSRRVGGGDGGCCGAGGRLGLAGRGGLAEYPGTRQAVRLEQFSIAWMLIEAAVTGAVAHRRVLALTSLGFDSIIELVSAVLVLRYLHAELADGLPR